MIELAVTSSLVPSVFFFFQAEDGIRDTSVTGVQTCALPIFRVTAARRLACRRRGGAPPSPGARRARRGRARAPLRGREIGRASCRERGEIAGGAGSMK